MALQFYNTGSRAIETFVPREPGKVTLYTCGPTVYDRLHVGNWASYVRWDLLVRLLRINGYDVNRVMNITDVGHLVSDDDEGQDKLEKGAAREGKTAWDVAQFYTDDFLAGMDALNMITPDTYARATDYITQQLSLLRVLKEKGFTYQISDGIYFDTAKFPKYGDFARLDLAGEKAGARVTFNPEKRNIGDFALWKFTPDGEHRDMEWETPADLLEVASATPKNGFPGWHLECSAIAINTLGETLDIHTGGIDHIPVHHTNEIAQSEAATGVEFSRFWIHANFLTVDGTKISKSLGNGFTLADLAEHDFMPLDFRMLVLQSHYRTEANFTWDSLSAAASRLRHWREVAALRWQTKTTNATPNAQPSRASIRALLEALNNDLDTPSALELVDSVLTQVEQTPLTGLDSEALTDFFEAVDALLGLNLLRDTADIDDDLKSLILERERVRESKDFAKSDQLRNDLKARGIGVRDIPADTVWYRL